MEATLQRDAKAVVQHLESFDHELTYAEFVAEIAASTPSGSDIHWMADIQLVNIFFSRRTARPELLTDRLRRWLT